MPVQNLNNADEANNGYKKNAPNICIHKKFQHTHKLELNELCFRRLVS